MFANPILSADSYKASHWLQYPPGTSATYSYIESRGGRWDRTLFFGLQAFLHELEARPVTAADVEEAEALLRAHGEPFNRAGWDRVVQKHGGRLPVAIRAVPEGSVVPVRNVLLTVCNTDPALFWLPSYLETALLRAVWYPTTVATNSYHCRLAIMDALQRTSDDPEGQIPFKLHDFGARGVSSSESAALGGLAHLVCFRGTDTLEALVAARRWYGEDVAGFSIPAAEHATITAWGRNGEADAYRNMLRQFARPGAVLACVSDSYDLDHAVRALWGGALREEVRQSGATVVVRPDSGDPLTIPVDTVAALAECFGSTVNAKGFRVLPPCVRVIQGDGINERSLRAILSNLEARGFAADNLAFGMGGGLLQQLDRDTLRFAMKCSAVEVDGQWRDVWKAPKTDPGKESKRGRLALVRAASGVQTVPLDGREADDLLHEVFRNGTVVNRTNLAEVRQRAGAGLGLRG